MAKSQIESQPLGLTSAEVAEKMRAGLYNKPVKAPSKSVGRIIFDNTFTYFNGVFIALALILLSVRSYRDLTFLGVILCNTLIGIVQELRTKKVLDKLTVLHAQKTTALRDGKETAVPVNELVLGDVVIFRAGDQIPADATILDGSVSVNEALITGEADEIQKSKNAELLSGSFIVSGECYAKLTKVGDDSYVSKLTLQAKAIKTGEQSEIIRSLNALVKLAGFAIIPIGIALFCQQFFLSHASIEDSIQGMAAAVIGMIPEGLFLLASVSLAISAVRLAQNEVLVHEMKCIETLARVDVLCVDKTGTITSPDMHVKEWVPLNNAENTDVKIASFVSALSADNATMKALKEHFKASKEAEKPEQVFGFSSQFKYSAVKFKKGNYVLGAPEFTLKNDYDKYKAQIQKYSRKGYRVLIFGTYAKTLDGKELQTPIKPEAMIILENPVRKTAPETFAYFKNQGVAIKVISGDNALTVSEVARQAGIDGAGDYIDASTLDTDEKIAAAVEKYTVFGRVTPEQKRKFVKALQEKRHYVAMTGDGVNDVLALKDADCSVAMASGSDAAVHAAQLVLLESDFSKMPAVVREGRRVVNNLERSGSLFIVKNVFSLTAAVLVLILGLFSGISYPLLPAQVSLVTMWTIGVPSFFLAQMPNEDLIRGRFITNILGKAIPGGLTCLVAIFIARLFCGILNIPAEEVTTACTLVFAIVGLLYLYRVCRPFNTYRRVVWGACLLGFTLCAIFLRWAFRLSDDISITSLGLAAVVGLASYPLLVFLSSRYQTHMDRIAAKLSKGR